jgi:hypothetical protein
MASLRGRSQSIYLVSHSHPSIVTSTVKDDPGFEVSLYFMVSAHRNTEEYWIEMNILMCVILMNRSLEFQKCPPKRHKRHEIAVSCTVVIVIVVVQLHMHIARI